jgi:hypothetical protein
MLPREFGELLRQLNEADFPYVLVGGVAVNLLGYSRATRDVDVLVPDDPGTGQAIASFLEATGATRPDGSSFPAILFDGEHHIRALTPWGLIDFIPAGADALSWSVVAAAAVSDELHDVVVRRADLETIVRLKRLADRPRDREDLAALARAYGALPDTD